MALEKFGSVSPTRERPVNFSSCKQRTIKLVKTKNDLIQRLQVACNPLERSGLEQLLCETKSELRKLRKKEKRRKRRVLKNRQRKSFKTNPYRFGKDLLTPKNFSKLSLPTAELDNILRKLHSDPLKDDPLPPLDGLPDPPSIKVKFDGSSISFVDFEALFRTR